MCNALNLNNIMEFIVKGIICLIIPNILYILIYKNDNLYNESRQFAVGLIERIKNKVTG